MGICRRQTNMSLYDLQRRYQNKSHLKPQWQRGDVWTKKKREDFERTVRNKAKRGSDVLTGCVILYYTEADQKNVWISDGLQRTINSVRIYEKLVEEVGEKDAENIMSRISVPVLEMEYEGEKEAKDEFRRINQGTPLTPKEEAKTILTDLSNYEDWDVRIFTPLHTSLANALNQFGVKNTNSRGRKHHSERDDYGLFLRYISKEKTACKYNFDVTNIEDETKRQNVLEQKLVNKLRELGIDESEQRLTAFTKYLQDQVAYIKDIWEKIPKQSWDSEIQTVTAVCLRLLLHLAIFRMNKGIPLDRFEKFISKFLEASKGTSNVRYSDGGYKVISMGDLSGFSRVQQKLDCILDPDLKPSLARKRKKTAQLFPGMHNAHKLAFSKNDEDCGNTIPIPATRNMSMGVLPIG